MTYELDLSTETFPLILGRSPDGKGGSAWTLFVRDREAHGALIRNHSRFLDALYFTPTSGRGLTYRQSFHHGLTEMEEFARVVIDAGGLILPSVAFPTSAEAIARELAYFSTQFEIPRVGYYDRATGRAIVLQSDTIRQSFQPGDRVQLPAVTRTEKSRAGALTARVRTIPARVGSVVRFEALDVVSATERRQGYRIQLDAGPALTAHDGELERVAAVLVTEIAPLEGGEVLA